MLFAVQVYRGGRLTLRGPFDSRQAAQDVLGEEMSALSGVREPCGAAILHWPPAFGPTLTASSASARST